LKIIFVSECTLIYVTTGPEEAKSFTFKMFRCTLNKEIRRHVLYTFAVLSKPKPSCE